LLFFTKHEPVSFVLILHCISIIRRFSFSSLFDNDGIEELVWIIVDIESFVLCSNSFVADLDRSNIVVPFRDLIPLFINVVELESFVLIG